MPKPRPGALAYVLPPRTGPIGETFTCLAGATRILKYTSSQPPSLSSATMRMTLSPTEAYLCVMTPVRP